MSDAAIKARTGKDWAAWFGALDKAGAAELDHRTIARMVSEKYGLPGWWCQMVTLQYELARGLRVRHETAGGFSVSVSKTIPTRLSELYEAAADPAKRRKWFPSGAFAPSSQTKDKYLRGTWNKRARVEIGFYAKGRDKAQIAVGIKKLAKLDDVERERRAWKAALVKLQTVLER